jgi:hypothetical protein
MKLHVTILFIIVCIMTAYSQQTVTVSASKDNTLYQSTDGSTSNGAGISLFAGRTNQAGNNIRRAVIKFDLTGKLPENAVITWAKLKLNMSKSPVGAFQIKVHRLLADWGEGTSDAGSGEGGGAPAATNDATWIHKFFNTQTWTTPGGDYLSTPSAALSVGGVGSYTWEDTLLWADVVSWHASPASNFGWILLGDETTQSVKRFNARNDSLPANRPQLIIEYTVPTGVLPSSGVPSDFVLEQNFPNPFNPATSISFALPNSGFTTLAVYDLLGNHVASLVNGQVSAGRHTVQFDAYGLASGIYFYRLQSGHYSGVKKLIVLQ